METIHKIGRRKTAIARVYLSKGKGEITVNKKPLAVYFAPATLQYKVNQPFALTETAGQYNLTATVVGVGLTGKLRPYALLFQERFVLLMKRIVWY